MSRGAELWSLLTSFLSHPDGGGCAAGKRLSRHPLNAELKAASCPSARPGAAGSHRHSLQDASATPQTMTPPRRTLCSGSQGGGGDRRWHFPLGTTPGKTRLPNPPTPGEQPPPLLIRRGRMEACSTGEMRIFHPKSCLSVHEPFPVPSPSGFAAPLWSRIWPQL